MINFKKELPPRTFKIVLAIGGIILLVLILYLGFLVWKIKAYKNPPPPELIKTFIIKGNSMEPTLKDGQEVKADLYYYKFHKFQEGDIITLKFGTSDEIYVKRVIAVPGDKLQFKDGLLWLNGKELKEDYILDKNYKFSKDELRMVFFDQEEREIPEDTVLILSDNRASNFDSRKFGILPTYNIIGKVMSY